MSVIGTIFALILASGGAIIAQNIKVMDYPAFEERIQKEEGTVTIYNFWATWCKPCVKEIPYFEELNESYGEKDVKVVFVSLDFKNQLKKVKKFVVQNDLKAEVMLLDAPNYNDWINKVSPVWQGSIPATLVVNHKTGKRNFHEGEFNYQQLEKFVNSVL